MPQRLIKITDEIYCNYSSSYFNCTYIVYRNDEVTLIDTGMKSDASDVKFALRELNIPIEKIKSILLTHWHNDHSAGAAELKGLTNCITYCHQNEARYFELEQSSRIRRLADYIPEHGIFVLFKGLIGDTVPRPVSIDRKVRTGEIIDGDFEVIHTPGHTGGHIAYFDVESGFLFAGDALAVVNGKLRLMASIVTENKKEALESIIEMLQGERTIKAICPGHREPLTKNVSEEIESFIEKIKAQKRWPILG
ncbi:MBL fold metallo-hydrolase [Parvicella tangerina]|uniref:Hydroxyacylglutathione hydrolase n=1 Tax=Parvicella tangerina TaxID=2829795 RepID=A0A916JM89_9FLAO|nr:MBL fold metallo-hydrolase [Parvicella tangerina]CAG5081140.1 Hydroxyacylglutathione hydrolase [Parvicella tangerina]